MLNVAGGNKSVFKATSWYLVCDFLIKGIAFITMPIFTRLMNASEIGSFAILSSWISIFSVVVTLNLVQAVFLAKYDYKKDYDEFISTISTLGFLSVVSCYIVIFPFRSDVAHFLCIDEYALDVMSVHLMFCQMSSVLLAKYRANFEYIKSVLLTIGTTLIVTVSAIICTVVLDDSLKGRIYGTFAPTIIINVCLYIFFLYRKSSFKWEYCKYALAICVPLIIHNLAGNLMHSSDRVMIGKFCSAEDTGLYSVAYSCAMFANVIRNSMVTAWNPWLFDNLNRNDVVVIRKGSYFLLTAFLILCVGIVMFAPEILYILGGNTYVSAKYVVPPVVSAYVFSMVYSLYAGIEQYYKKQKYFAIFAVPCAVFNILLNYLLIPVYGYIAAAYTTMACLALECFLHYVNVHRMNMSHIYNGKFNMLIIILMLGMILMSGGAYRSNMVRYSIILCFFVISIALLMRYKNIIVEFTSMRLNKNDKNI